MDVLIAPYLGDPKFMGIFTYIQEFQGYISPGILAAFVFGILVKKAPPAAGVVALLACVPVYGFLQWQFGEIAFSKQNGNYIWHYAFLDDSNYNLLSRLRNQCYCLNRTDIDLTPTPQLIWLGGLVIFITLVFYVIFW